MNKVLRVKEDARWVAGQARHVMLRRERIEEYTAFILEKYKDSFVVELSGDTHYISDDKEDTLSYILALDTLNFGSACFNLARDIGLELRYTVFANSLKGTFQQQRLNTPEEWLSACAEDFFTMLSIARGTHEKLDLLMEQFACALRQAGAMVMGEYNGRVSQVLEAAQGSAARLVDIVADWECFKDSAVYKGREVFILKRAQILAADIHLVYKCFDDMAQLSMFADNDVPHVLRHDGVLEYTEELAGKIDSGQPLASGSEEEVELRCMAIDAVEQMAACARHGGRDITSVNLDHLLWHRGQEEALYRLPKHRTFTTCY